MALGGGFERHFRSGAEGEAAPIGEGQRIEILHRSRTMRVAQCVGIHSAGTVSKDRSDPALKGGTIAYATVLNRVFETVRIAECANRKAGR